MVIRPTGIDRNHIKHYDEEDENEIRLHYESLSATSAAVFAVADAVRNMITANNAHEGFYGPLFHRMTDENIRRDELVSGMPEGERCLNLLVHFTLAERYWQTFPQLVAYWTEAQWKADAGPCTYVVFLSCLRKFEVIAHGFR